MCSRLTRFTVIGVDLTLLPLIAPGTQTLIGAVSVATPAVVLTRVLDTLIDV